MYKRIFVLWLVGLTTLVPYALYHLFFTATRDQYAFLISVVLIWVFGFWGLVGPLISIYRLYPILRALDRAKSSQDFAQLLHHTDNETAAVELIATEWRLPRPVALWLYRRGLSRWHKEVGTEL